MHTALQHNCFQSFIISNAILKLASERGQIYRVGVLIRESEHCSVSQPKETTNNIKSLHTIQLRYVT